MRKIWIVFLLVVLPCGVAAQDEPAEGAAAANEILRQCAATVERLKCVEAALGARAPKHGIAHAMGVLAELAARDSLVRRDAHPLAHGLGMAAFRDRASFASTFATCPHDFIGGCHHGLVQAYFLSLGNTGVPVESEDALSLCEDAALAPADRYQCGHGLGHGLMAVLNNDLPRVLRACDLSGSVFVSVSCHGGAFMENIVRVTHPHHTAEAHSGVVGDTSAAGGHHAAAGDAPSHAHPAHGAVSAPEWVPLRADEPLYPCTVVAERYQPACYWTQTSAVLYFNGGDMGLTARICETAPGAMIEVCLESLGRDITAYANLDHAGMLAMCEEAARATSGRAREPCLSGVARTLVNYAGDPEHGLAFCRALRDAAGKNVCYRTTGSALVTRVPEAAERARLCAAAEAGFAGACAAGAGVPPRPETATGDAELH